MSWRGRRGPHGGDVIVTGTVLSETMTIKHSVHQTRGLLVSSLNPLQPADCWSKVYNLGCQKSSSIEKLRDRYY